MSGAVADTRFLRGLSTEFLQRHNRPGPRYTSYPTAPEWGEEVTERELRAMLRGRSAANPAAPLSLYFHIPFCEHRCSFCACNAIATPKREVVDPYLRALDQEMEIFASELAAAGADQRPVTQLHFGGGTPTFLTPPEIEWLMDRIRSHFHIGEGAEISVEIDPCVTDAAHMRTLRAQGFNRVSLGVQDFDSTTQQSIERVQTVEETRELTDLARELGFDSVNFDLVYGLPHQTPETINRSLDIILEMR
ncbi:radical SAM protein, partial [Candidatus Sumerlaeota bacterium]|nr:radical SAM protein [Candidatus Sumerlaeota bacterium]